MDGLITELKETWKRYRLRGKPKLSFGQGKLKVTVRSSVETEEFA